MQALERTVIEINWTTILLVVLFVFIFLLKVISARKLRGNLTSLIYSYFIETEIRENKAIFNLFQTMIFVFSMTVLSLLIYKILLFHTIFIEEGLYTLFKIFVVVSSYFASKWFLEFLFSSLFKIHNQVEYYLISKSSSLYAVLFILLIGIVLVEYSKLSIPFLICLSVVLFSVRFISYLATNKKLIFNKFFYFFLYFCIFEIMPVLILFKLLF